MAPIASVHADGDFERLQLVRELTAGELAAMIRIASFHDSLAFHGEQTMQEYVSIVLVTLWSSCAVKVHNDGHEAFTARTTSVCDFRDTFHEEVLHVLNMIRMNLVPTDDFINGPIILHCLKHQTVFEHAVVGFLHKAVAPSLFGFRKSN